MYAGRLPRQPDRVPDSPQRPLSCSCFSLLLRKVHLLVPQLTVKRDSKDRRGNASCVFREFSCSPWDPFNPGIDERQAPGWPCPHGYTRHGECTCMYEYLLADPSGASSAAPLTDGRTRDLGVGEFGRIGVGDALSMPYWDACFLAN